MMIVLSRLLCVICLSDPQRAHTCPDVSVTSLTVSASPSPGALTSIDHVTQSNTLTASAQPPLLDCEIISTAF